MWLETDGGGAAVEHAAHGDFGEVVGFDVFGVDVGALFAPDGCVRVLRMMRVCGCVEVSPRLGLGATGLGARGWKG